MIFRADLILCEIIYVVPPEAFIVDDTVAFDEAEYDAMSDLSQIKLFKENAVTYIAGYVARNVRKHETCTDCSAALIGDICKCESSELLAIKNRGGLKIPSSGTVTVCNAAEHCFHIMQFVLNVFWLHFFVATVPPALRAYSMEAIN